MTTTNTQLAMPLPEQGEIAPVNRFSLGYITHYARSKYSGLFAQIQRRENSPYGLDTIDVSQSNCGSREHAVIGDVEISTASWRGNIADTRAFAAQLLAACDFAEKNDARVAPGFFFENNSFDGDKEATYVVYYRALDGNTDVVYDDVSKRTALNLCDDLNSLRGDSLEERLIMRGLNCRRVADIASEYENYIASCPVVEGAGE